MKQPRTKPASDVGTPGASWLAGGSSAGFAGGVVMAAYLVFAAAVQGMEPLAALEPMGATFGDANASGGAGRVLFGLVLHLAVSALVGLMFAMILPWDFTPGNAAILCAGFAFVVMGFMTSAIVPAVNPVLEESFHDLGGSWVIAHGLFGLTTGYACQWLRRGSGLRAARDVRVRTA